MQRFKAITEALKKRLLISNRFDDYLPPASSQEKNLFRFPSPGSRPADFTPRKSEQNTYDIGYYKRQDTRTNAFTGVDVAKAAELRNMKECPEKYQVMPAHLPRPVWWDRQETVDREARERGILYAGGELPELELKVIESEQDNDDGQATRTTPEDVAAGRTKKFQLYT